MPREGQELASGYRLERRLGHGAFGEVWRAMGPGGTRVALKLLPVSRRSGLKEFRAIQRIKAIRHANLMPITALWLLDDNDQVLSEDSIAELESPDSGAREQPPKTLVAAMLLGDKNLREHFDECRDAGKRGIPPQELLGYMANVAQGLDFLNQPRHDLGEGPVAIQHCDVKPENIMLLGDSALVCDFGMARILGDVRITSQMAGTPAYLPPECINSDTPSAASDQYSLALSYFEMRTGELPFKAGSLMAVLRVHADGLLDLSALPKAERAVIARATDLDPARRFPSAAAMVDALRRAVEEPQRKRLSSDLAPATSAGGERSAERRTGRRSEALRERQAGRQSRSSDKTVVAEESPLRTSRRRELRSHAAGSRETTRVDQALLESRRVDRVSRRKKTKPRPWWDRRVVQVVAFALLAACAFGIGYLVVDMIKSRRGAAGPPPASQPQLPGAEDAPRGAENAPPAAAQGESSEAATPGGNGSQ